jgi:ubiquinone/menaquinone biosynthesis C-methylase UbiE
VDTYTKTIKEWLDERFKKTDEEGIYFAHQPIYGFRKGYSEYGVIIRYIITYQILKVLTHLQFESFLDVGGAEGYKSALVRSLLKKNVLSCDISTEACNRAKEIYNVDTKQVDIHKLPFNDNSFDVVLCSETLEHIPDIEQAVNELVRVCRKAVVITIPHEPKAKIKRNIEEKSPHAHIHSLNADSFDFIQSKVAKIHAKKMINPFCKVIYEIAEGVRREVTRKYPKIFTDVYNALVPIIISIFGKKTVSFLMHFDNAISRILPFYYGVTFILLKDKKCYLKRPMIKVNPSQIIDFEVPFYYVKKKNA